MHPQLLELLCCPRCEVSGLVVEQASTRELVYHDRTLPEIEQGTVVCRSCHSYYAIEQYVLSFADLLSPGVRADGAYWGDYYRRLYEYGITGFLDTRTAPAPFLSMGVPHTLPLDGAEWGGPHAELADHPWVKPGGRVVDVGVGSGWSSLFLARRGFQVLACDPALELMYLAKQYAISQGVYLEYVCSDLANLRVRADSVDAVFAMHSLHHVPDLEQGLRQIHAMLKQGGCLALDDHFQDAPLMALLRDGLLQEGYAQIFPALYDPALPRQAPSVHSENEGVGIGQLLPAIERYLHIDQVEYRHVGLDFAGPLFYLQQGCDPAALRCATQVIQLINRGMQRTLPDMVEYIMLVAQKRAELPAAPRYAPGPRDRFLSVQEHITDQAAELQRLHAIIAEKNAHIAALEQLLERIQNGRLLRLLRRFGL